MGNLAAELQQMTNKAINHKQEIIDEIINNYREYLNNINFEESFKKSLDKGDITRGYKEYYYSFWAYHEGCCDTNFRLGGYAWRNGSGYESRTYKNIKLVEIQKEVLEGMIDVLRTKLNQVGLKMRAHEYGEWFRKNKLGYIEDCLDIYWKSEE